MKTETLIKHQEAISEGAKVVSGLGIPNLPLSTAQYFRKQALQFKQMHESRTNSYTYYIRHYAENGEVIHQHIGSEKLNVLEWTVLIALDDMAILSSREDWKKVLKQLRTA